MSEEDRLDLNSNPADLPEALNTQKYQLRKVVIQLKTAGIRPELARLAGSLSNCGGLLRTRRSWEQINLTVNKHSIDWQSNKRAPPEKAYSAYLS